MKTIADLMHAATTGDRQAIQALMDLGEGYLKEGDLTSAAQAFKEAAISYRIDAFRQTANYEEEYAQSRWSLRIIEQIFVNWLEARPHLIPSKRPEILNIPDAKLIEMLRSSEHQEISVVIVFLEQTLQLMGVHFYSPGGSSVRRIHQLLRAFGGNEDDWAKQFLSDVRVRLAIDQLTDRLLNASKKNIT